MRSGIPRLLSPLITAAAAGIVLQACGGTGGRTGRPPPELAGTGWEIVQVDGRARTGAALTANFSAEGRVTGDSGCNTFAGPYIQTGATLRFGELLSTRRACVDSGRQQQETRVLAIMNGETRISRDGSELRIEGTNGSLRLEPLR